MPVSGQLTKDRFGYSMPVDEPLYTPFPLYYEDVRILLFPYLTDVAAAAALVPSQFELVPADPAGKFAIAQVVFAKYPFSNIGGYNEVAQTVVVTYKGTPGTYAVRLHVTNDQAMAAGREIGGFPKKLGKITFDEGADLPQHARVAHRPADLHRRARSAAAGAGQRGDHPTTFFSLRRDSESGGRQQALGLPADRDRVGPVRRDVLVRRAASCTSTAASALNPYHALPILQQMAPLNTNPQTELEKNTPGVGLFRGNMKITQVTVLEDF